MRINGHPREKGTHDQRDPVPGDPVRTRTRTPPHHQATRQDSDPSHTRRLGPDPDPDPPSSPLSNLGNLTTLGAQRRRRRRWIYSMPPYPHPSLTVEQTARNHEIDL